MSGLFHAAIAEAERGKQIIEKYFDEHFVSMNRHGRVLILIFPDDDERLYEPVSECIDRFIRESGHSGAIVLSSINIEQYNLSAKLSIPFCQYSINKSDMDAVLRFYSFVVGLPNVKLISLRMPFNQKAEILIGYKDVTAEKITRYYLLPTFKEGS